MSAAVGEGGLVRRRVQVTNRDGLHARPAALLAEKARGFAAEIALVVVQGGDVEGGGEGGGEGGAEAGQRADAKNVMDVMFLAAPAGTVLEIEAAGPDADAAVDALAELFRTRFSA